MTEPSSRRRSRSSDAQPVMGDHPELETDDIPQAESIENTAGRSRLMIAGIVALVLVVILILLLVI